MTISQDNVAAGTAKTVADVQTAARLLQADRCLIFPTETFFGLAASAFSSPGCALVYQAKKRSASKPLPLIACDTDMVEKLCDLSPVPKWLLALWPAPLTLVLGVRAKWASQMAAPLLDGKGCVAIRVSPHPVARKLARILGAPITATSANISGREPVTEARLLDPELAGDIPVLDLPPKPAGGLPSTILSFPSPGTILLHREGAISRDELARLGIRTTRLVP